MQNVSLFSSASPKKREQGFNLVELTVVMCIACILACGVVFMFANPTAKVKAVAFNLLADLNLARSEAVEKNLDVLVDFVLGRRDGYWICFDSDADKDCNNEKPENILKKVLFAEEVQFYDCSTAPPYPEGGPDKTPAGTPLAGKTGLIFGGPTHIRWQPDGTSSDNGSIIVYHPDHKNPLKVRGSPFAAVISSAATGRMRIMRWHRDRGWSRK